MKKLLFVILCSAVAFLSSCWDARELSDIGIVLMTGFDLDDDGLDRVTVFSVQPFGQASAQGEAATTWYGTASGKSIYEAMRNLRRTASRRLIWVHNKLILIGQDKAKQGITNITDVISRSREFRYDTTVFVTDGTAGKLMQTPAELEKSLVRELLGMVENTSEWTKGYALDVKELSLNSLASYQHGFVIGNMGLYKSDSLPFSIDRREYLKMYWKESEENIAYIGGGAVIDKDRLVGWLSPTELQGYLVLGNQIEEGYILYENMPLGGYEITVEVNDLKTEVSFPKVSKEEISALVKVKATVSLQEVNGTIPEYDVSFIKKLERALSNELASDLSLIVRRAQNELRTDFIGFHEDFSIEHAREWKALGGNWCEVFCRIGVDYDVEMEIKSEGLLSRTYHSEGT